VKRCLITLGWLIVGLGSALVAPAALAANVLPRPEPPFAGKVGFSAKDAVAAWPQPPTAPAGAPNIVVILLDDVGFADTHLFGGVVQTPALAQLAAQGLRYNNFHTTALCSPSRGALLTGWNTGTPVSHEYKPPFGFTGKIEKVVIDLK